MTTPITPLKMYGGNAVQENAVPVRVPAEMPITGGRSSVSDTGFSVASALSEMTVALPEYPFEFLEGLEMLGKWHGDVGFAADNVVQLALTNYRIYFEDSLSEDKKRKAITHLRSVEKKWYPKSGGMPSLISDLIYQIVINGALSAEMVAKKDLSGIEKVVLVKPKHIRFKYNNTTDEYEAYQQVAGTVKFIDGLKKLNPNTYKYLSLRRSGDVPYGLPPFLSAIESVQRGKEMLTNLNHIIKKFGAMGFVEALVRAPARDLANSESEPAYYLRMQEYLKTIAPPLQQGMKEGIVVGFEGGHSFKYNPIASGNAINSQKLFEMNDVMTAAGLKQDASMLSRNTSTTETLSRVVLAKLVKQMGSYQNLVGHFMSELYMAELLLAGMAVKQVLIEFEAPMVGDREKEELARSHQIANADSLFQQGIIGQQDRAQELGYDQPYRDKPLVILPPATPAKAKPASGTDPSKEKKVGLSQSMFSLNADLPMFPYDAGHMHGTLRERFDKDSDIDNFILKYFADTHQVYNRAVAAAVRRIAEMLLELGETVDLSTVQDKTLFTLFKHWAEDFALPQQIVTEKWVNQAYDFFRSSKNPFGGASGIPDSVFNNKDYRALEYMKNSDGLYLGKFITDDDTKKKLMDLIADKYLTNGLPVAGDGSKVGAFQDALGEVLLGEEWKIERIIATTLSKARNYSSVIYMDQALVERFVVRGINDSKQCKFCASMQGRVFSVKIALEKIESETSGSPASVKRVSPFITSVYKKADDMKGLSDEKIQLSGIDTPPFHSFCRDQIVADI